jgi:hypothetical protein
MKWIFYIYCGLMMNLGFVMLNLPFFMAANFLKLQSENFGIFLLSTILFYPAIISVFAVINYYRSSGDIAPFKNFFNYGLKKFGLKGLKYGCISTLILLVVISDSLLFVRLPFAKISVPFCLILSLLIVAMSINMMYFRVRNPKASEKDIFRIAFYYSLRKCYVSFLNILLFAGLIILMFIKPQFGFMITPVLFIGIIFLNCAKLHQNS